MDLTQLANLGEFIGGVAVLVTLAYLAIQIRASRKAFKFSSIGTIREQINSINLAVAASPELGRLFLKGGASIESLEPAESIRFHSLAFAYFNVWEQTFLESREGVGSGLWRSSEIGMQAVLVTAPGMVDWWNSNPTGFSPEFCSVVNDFLADPERMRATARYAIPRADSRGGREPAA